MTSRKPATNRTTFFDHLKQALEAFDDADWLGTHSPLAAPYFLGDAVRQADATATGRGQTRRNGSSSAKAPRPPGQGSRRRPALGISGCVLFHFLLCVC